MNETQHKVCLDAQAVINGLASGGGANADEVISIKTRILGMAGVEGTDVSAEKWEEILGSVPVEVRSVLIAFDDALNFQDSTSLMYNL